MELGPRKLRRFNRQFRVRFNGALFCLRCFRIWLTNNVEDKEGDIQVFVYEKTLPPVDPYETLLRWLV